MTPTLHSLPKDIRTYIGVSFGNLDPEFIVAFPHLVSETFFDRGAMKRALDYGDLPMLDCIRRNSTTMFRRMASTTSNLRVVSWLHDSFPWYDLERMFHQFVRHDSFEVVFWCVRNQKVIVEWKHLTHRDRGWLLLNSCTVWLLHVRNEIDLDFNIERVREVDVCLRSDSLDRGDIHMLLDLGFDADTVVGLADCWETARAFYTQLSDEGKRDLLEKFDYNWEILVCVIAFILEAESEARFSELFSCFSGFPEPTLDLVREKYPGKFQNRLASAYLCVGNSQKALQIFESNPEMVLFLPSEAMGILTYEQLMSLPNHRFELDMESREELVMSACMNWDLRVLAHLLVWLNVPRGADVSGLVVSLLGRPGLRVETLKFLCKHFRVNNSEVARGIRVHFADVASKAVMLFACCNKWVSARDAMFLYAKYGMIPDLDLDRSSHVQMSDLFVRWAIVEKRMSLLLLFVKVYADHSEFRVSPDNLVLLRSKNRHVLHKLKCLLRKM